MIHFRYLNNSYSGEYARRFFDWKVLGNGRFAVDDGRYVNCTCLYETEKDGLRVEDNPECIIHGKNAETGSSRYFQSLYGNAFQS